MTCQRIFCVAIVVAALAAATPVMAQRLSLGERVTQLENQANAQQHGTGQANIDALNRMVQLQAEIQALRNQVEMLQNEIQQLQQRSRDQYLDLDGRLARLEGGAAASSPNPPAATASVATASRTAPSGVVASVAAANPADTAPALPASDPANEDAAYQAALDTLVERFEAADAARQFQAFIRSHPASPLVPNAYYWLGESYYVTQNYDLALGAFQTLLAQHPGSRKEADAHLKIGFCLVAMGQRAEGEATLREVSARHAGTDAAGKADSRLRTLALENR